MSIDCRDERLQRRYIEIRRPHLSLAIALRSAAPGWNRRAVSPLPFRADPVIDAPNLNAAELKRPLMGHSSPDARGLRIFMTSSSYRPGIPRGADLNFEVRPSRQPPLFSGASAVVRVGSQLSEQLRAGGVQTGLSHREFPQFGPSGSVPSGASMAKS
jgi:P-loop ATPase protein family